MRASSAQKQIRAMRGQVAPGGVAGGPEPGDEQGRGAARLPERLRVHARVVRERRGEGQPDQKAERGEQPDRQLPGPAHREVHADKTGERRDERHDADAPGQVAAEVGAEREEASRDRHVAHGLREKGVRPAAGCRSNSLVAQ